MIKSLIPFLLAVAVLCGCAKKQDASAADTAKAAPAATSVATSIPAPQIAPPTVVDGKAGPLQVTIPAGGNGVQFQVRFDGKDKTQSVSIGDSVVPYSPNGTVAFDTRTNSTTGPLTIVVIAHLGSAKHAYPSVESVPPAGFTEKGGETTTYKDAKGNTAEIKVWALDHP